MVLLSDKQMGLRQQYMKEQIHLSAVFIPALHYS